MAAAYAIIKDCTCYNEVASFTINTEDKKNGVKKRGMVQSWLI
jgi:hypothetical protein